MEIARIAVIDEMKRQGVGHALMLALKAWSKEHQIAKVLLDVRESNQAAGAFYAREGFINDGVRKAFYQDPKEDAVLMSLEIDCLLYTSEICDMLGTADEEEMNALMEELGTIQDELTLHDFYTIDAKVEEVARALGLLDLGLDRDVTDLSGCLLYTSRCV